MIAIILQSPPESSVYRLGLETALNLADAGLELEVRVRGACARRLYALGAQAAPCRELNQLELYDIRPHWEEPGDGGAEAAGDVGAPLKTVVF